MRKFTLLIASLFVTIGAMAQTFVAPETGKLYKIKGASTSHPWLTASTNTSGNVVVSANESDAAIFEKTENGLKAVSTGKYLGYSGGKYTYSDNEITVELLNTGDQANSEGKYAIRSGNNYMYNNNTDGIVHESSLWLDIERLWGFIEYVEKVVEDGVYTIDNIYNGRGSMCYGTWNGSEYFALTGITLSGYTNNNLTVSDDADKYWYVKTTAKGVYFYNIGKGLFLQEYSAEKVSCGENVEGDFTMESRTNSNTDYISVKSGDYYLSYSCGWEPNSSDGSVRWLQSDEAAATLMTFTSVADAATTYADEITAADELIATYEMDNSAAKEALQAAIGEIESYINNGLIGEEVGLYSTTVENAGIIYLDATTFYQQITDETEISAIEVHTTALTELKNSYTLNVPAVGKYYRLKNAVSGNYMSANATNVTMLTEGAAASSTVFYLAENNELISYTQGRYLDCSAKNLAAVGTSYAGAFGPAYGTPTANVVTYKNNGCWTYGDRGNGVSIDRGNPNPNLEGYNWIFEEVTELPIEITSAGYATLYAPVALEVSSGVKAYTVTINATTGNATLNEITSGVIPANTGVVLAGEEGAPAIAGTYDFIITTSDAFNGSNALTGTVASMYETNDSYVLGINNDEVGFYTATKNQSSNAAFLANGHKAYLLKSSVPSTAQDSAGFRFNFDGVTAIEEVEGENGAEAVYGLQGRRINEITKPGIYIVNGNKVLVK